MIPTKQRIRTVSFLVTRILTLRQTKLKPMKLIRSTLAVLAIIGAASTGFGNNQAASMTTASAPGYESKTALHAPPAINTIALQFKDTTGTPLAFTPFIPDPTATTGAQGKINVNVAINGKQEEAGINTAGAVSSATQNTTTYAVTNVDTGEKTAAAWTKTNATDTANAPNTGRQEGSMGLVSALFGGTGQGVFQQHSA